MQPTFQTDLVCTREEQDGVVYYHLEDPRTQSSFRLYEIEYYIAQQLDGQRTLVEVAEILKRDRDFTISQSDLLKFVEQLKSMNFVQWEQDFDADSDPPGPHSLMQPMGEIATMEMSLRDLEAPLYADPPASGGPNRVGSRQMLASGLTHLRQGELAFARDFIISAQQKDPKQPNLDRLLELFDSLGASPTPTEMAHLWRQCEAWYPEIVATLGPQHQPKRRTTVHPRATPKSGELAADFSGTNVAAKPTPVWKRGLVGGGLVGIVAISAVAFWLLWNGAPEVRARTLEPERIPIFAPQPAIDKDTLQDVWIAFERGGNVGEIVSQGKRVSEHEVLVALSVPVPQLQVLNAMHASVGLAEKQLVPLQAALDKLQQGRVALQNQQADAIARMNKLRPKSGVVDGVTRTEMAKIRKIVTHSSLLLGRTDAKFRTATAAVGRGKARLAALRQRQAELEARFGAQKRLAPFAGEVTEVRAKVGDLIRPGAPLVRLQNTSALKLKFVLQQRGAFHVGGEATVMAEAGPPLTATVRSLSPKRNGVHTLEVELRDPVGGLHALPAGAFHLIERYAEPAFRVGARALVRGNSTQVAKIILLVAGRATYRTVQVLSNVDGEAIIFATDGKLTGRDVMITGQQDGTPLAALKEGTEVDVVAP